MVFVSVFAIFATTILTSLASHLLAQTPLAVSPFTPLPTAPTLPHNYASLPSTLPPSILDAPNGAYVSSQGGFAARPDTIRSQNKAMLDQLRTAPGDAAKKVAQWKKDIDERELAERRRRAPGWLDRDEKILRPASIVGAPALDPKPAEPAPAPKQQVKPEEVDQLGDLMDKAFG